jgi:hypothetical protein
MTRIAYLAHDLSDPAVARRVAMLRRGGADVRLAGFVRAGGDPGRAGPALTLGRTEDARLIRRAGLVAATVAARLPALAAHVEGAEAIVARNLEMLAVAEPLARRLRPRPRLVYECLDIHRLLVAPGPAGRALRAAERRLARGVDLVLTSSPAFCTHHLDRVFPGRIRLVENKVFEAGAPARPTEAGPPWRIGWFGALRCRASLARLADAARRAEGVLEIVLRGRPSPAIFPDLAAEVRPLPHMRFAGPYGPDDLPRIYGEVHFSWCIDFYEQGENSAWLLPNRLYESACNATIPVALRGVETGRLLEREGLGVLLERGDAEEVATRLPGFDAPAYEEAVAALARAGTERWQAGDPECRALVAAIAGEAAMPPVGRAAVQ